MFWDNVAFVYDIFEKVINKKTNEGICVKVAANVIHLLDDPYKAIAELDRVCKRGGKIIIPTYLNKNCKGKTVCLLVL